MYISLVLYTLQVNSKIFYVFLFFAIKRRTSRDQQMDEIGARNPLHSQPFYNIAIFVSPGWWTCSEVSDVTFSQLNNVNATMSVTSVIAADQVWGYLDFMDQSCSYKFGQWKISVIIWLKQTYFSGQSEQFRWVGKRGPSCSLVQWMRYRTGFVSSCKDRIASHLITGNFASIRCVNLIE